MEFNVTFIENLILTVPLYDSVRKEVVGHAQSQMPRRRMASGQL